MAPSVNARTSLRDQVSIWIERLHDETTGFFTQLDRGGSFREDRWDRPGGGGGLSRVLTDGVQVSYLCDLAVEPDVQRLGVGKRLVDGVLERCRGTELVLRDSSLSAGCYERLGFAPVDNAWVRKA
jgi:GNAT superfamily N-acetyltransferase